MMEKVKIYYLAMMQMNKQHKYGENWMEDYSWWNKWPG
jgi:hypothetical protein